MSVHFAPATAPSASSASLLAELRNSAGQARTPAKGELAVCQKFQDFVGGTFYREMLKALRAGQKPSKYFNGKQAEKIFQGQMDQQIADDLAHQYAGHLAEPLYENYSRQLQTGSASHSTGEAGRALDAVA